MSHPWWIFVDSTVTDHWHDMTYHSASEWTQCFGGNASVARLVEKKQFLPHLHLAFPLWVSPLEFDQDLWHQKTIRVATLAA